MFAVPGWSVSADALKSETVKPSNGPSGAKSRKRKRTGEQTSEAVTSANVADLYETIVEGKKKPKGQDESSRGDASVKRSKKDKAAKAAPPKAEKKSDIVANDTAPKSAPKEKKNKKQKNDSASDKNASESTTTKFDPPATKLTPLQASMREKLVSARFRHLNETLYTRPSDEAFSLFDESPEMFDEYHEGFRRQVKVWPENPVDSFLGDIRARGKVKQPFKDKTKPSGPPPPRWRTCLPRTAGTCTIADLGCGDARLASSLQGEVGKLRLDVRSFDLQSPSPLVTKADIANLPLEDGSVNVAIFCLALMGTNWIDFVEEAYRILHWKGELWVAEIKSRFGPVRKGGNAVVDHSVGHRRKSGAKKKGKEEDGAEKHGQDLAIEIDGVEDRRGETDVSSFVEALKKRGFVLNGQQPGEAVDLSNKMFVKMHFIKGAAPTKGKGVKEAEEHMKMQRGGKKGFTPKWDTDALEADEKADASEAAILKPCVYKIR